MALAIAKETNTPVLFTPAELPLEVAEPIQSADVPVVVQLKQAPIMAIKPSGEEVEIAEVVTAPPVQAQAEAAPASGVAERTLPSTASYLPLMAAFGLLALGSALALRMAERRIQ